MSDDFLSDPRQLAETAVYRSLSNSPDVHLLADVFGTDALFDFTIGKRFINGDPDTFIVSEQADPALLEDRRLFVSCLDLRVFLKSADIPTDKPAPLDLYHLTAFSAYRAQLIDIWADAFLGWLRLSDLSRCEPESEPESEPERTSDQKNRPRVNPALQNTEREMIRAAILKRGWSVPFAATQAGVKYETMKKFLDGGSVNWSTIDRISETFPELPERR